MEITLRHFEELLKKEISVTAHERNIQTLAVDVFTVKIGIVPKILNEIVQLNYRWSYQ